MRASLYGRKTMNLNHLGDPPLTPMVEHVKGHEDVMLGLKAYKKIRQNLRNGSCVPRFYRLVIDY